MEHIIHNLSLNMHSSISQVSLSVKKGDTKRKLCITLTENGKVYQIAEGCVAVFSAKKDRGGILYNACTIVDNTIAYEFTEQTANIPGKLDCEIKLYDANNELITSPQFTIIVNGVVYEDDEVEDSNEFSALTEKFSELVSLKNEIKTKLDNGEFVGEQGLKGDKGDKGDTGYAPVKGVDYFTEADKADMVRALASPFANAIKGAAEGKEVTVYDVSPVEHTVKVKLTSGTITDFSSVSISRNGKNLYDTLKEISYSGAYNNSLVSDTKSKWFGKLDIDSLPNHFCVSTNIICEDYGRPQSSDTSLRIYYYDNAKEQISFKVGSVATAETPKSIVAFDKSAVPVGTKYVEIIIRINSTGHTENTQIELGSIATDYAPYVEPQVVVANADGTCEVVSVSPTMTLSTDNPDVTIECEYNRDIGAVFADFAYQMDELLRSAVNRISYVDLPASGWKGAESPYYQVVDLPGVTEYSKVDINPSVEQLDVFHDKDIAFVTENEGGVVTVYCVGQKPANDYSLQVSITEVMTID